MPICFRTETGTGKTGLAGSRYEGTNKKTRWAVALSTRSGPDYIHYPMGRETVMTAVSWPKGEYPTFTPVTGKMSGWPMPPLAPNIRGVG